MVKLVESELNLCFDMTNGDTLIFRVAVPFDKTRREALLKKYSRQVKNKKTGKVETVPPDGPQADAWAREVFFEVVKGWNVEDGEGRERPLTDYDVVSRKFPSGAIADLLNAAYNDPLKFGYIKDDPREDVEPDVSGDVAPNV